MSLLLRKQKQKRKALKTENMKTTMKKLAAGTFIAILLMVGNVQAEGTETKITTQAVETTLQIEKWMTSDNMMNIHSVSVTEIKNETEAALEIESWMANSQTWNINNRFIEETEAGLQVENWMTKSETWNTINIQPAEETQLTIENWMTSENIWNR